MRYRTLSLMGAAVFIFGCRGASDSFSEPQLFSLTPPAAAKSFRLAGQATNAALGDSAELALIADLKAMYPPKKFDAITRGLNSPTAFGMSVNDAKGQAILNKIFARRKARGDSLAAAAAQPGVQMGPHITVVIAFVDSLSDPTATAEIRRRATVEPHDVILIPTKHATIGAVGAALRGLGKIWRAEGQNVPTRNTRTVVHGEAHLRTWTATNEQLIAARVAEVLGAEKTNVAGVGSARTFELVLWQSASAQR